MTPNSRVRFGSFDADLATGELFHRGKALSLQEKPFQILTLLLKSPGRLITRQEISSRVWRGVFVQNDLCLNTAIRRLRAVLEKADPKCNLIETVGRRGYRLRTKAKQSQKDLHALAQLGRVEAPTRHRNADKATVPIPRLRTVLSMRQAVQRLIADVRAGKIQPKVAAELASLMEVELRVVETREIQQRLAELEKKVDQVPDEHPSRMPQGDLPRHIRH